MRQDDAFDYIVGFLRGKSHTRYTHYGFDLYLPSLIDAYLGSDHPVPREPTVADLKTAFPLFYAAAWTLCQLGVLRPGVREWKGQSAGDPGDGYSITPFGKTWLREAQGPSYIPVEPHRFAEVVGPFRDRFGAGFAQRSQEAVRCYLAHAYLACCAMCGAASESILLATAIAKRGDEPEVIRMYASAGGRGKVENLLVGQAKQSVQEEFRGFTSLVKYWRDEAAHGRSSQISENQAYIAMSLLLRFAQYVDESWDDLTRKVPAGGAPP